MSLLEAGKTLVKVEHKYVSTIGDANMRNIARINELADQAAQLPAEEQQKQKAQALQTLGFIKTLAAQTKGAVPDSKAILVSAKRINANMKAMEERNAAFLSSKRK